MPTDTNDLIQQQLIAARRKQILDAAIRVFADKGFHRATIRDIAHVAGIADGTIYNYFTNKTALLLGILNRLNQTEQREGDFAHAASMDVTTFMTMYLKQRLDTLGESGLNIFQVLLPEILVNAELRDTYYREVIEPTMTLGERYHQAWIDQGAIKPLDAALVTRALAGMVLGLMVLRLMGDAYLEEHWNEVADTLAQLSLHGLIPAANQGGSDVTDRATESSESRI